MAPLFWHTDPVIFDFSPAGAVLLCFLLGFFYVASLYYKYDHRLPRDHPEIIKQRFARVSAVCLFTIPFVWLCSTSSHSVKAKPFLTWIGIRSEGFLLATILPLILTMILFLGPLTLYYLDGIFRIYATLGYWKANMKNVLWLRNHVVAPITEEIVFRGCMLPVLVPCFGPVAATLTMPVFFGMAHCHHVYERVQEGVPLKTAVITALFQASYTSIFGIYSAFLFLRTGHLIAPIVAHAFCNHMGFPNYQEVLQYNPPQRYYITAMFVLGLTAWYFCLFSFTDPTLYSNDLYVDL